MISCNHYDGLLKSSQFPCLYQLFFSDPLGNLGPFCHYSFYMTVDDRSRVSVSFLSYLPVVFSLHIEVKQVIISLRNSKRIPCITSLQIYKYKCFGQMIMKSKIYPQWLVLTILVPNLQLKS